MNVLTALDDEPSTTRSLAALRWLTEVAETLADAASLEELARASEEVLRKHSGAERDGLYLIDFAQPSRPLRLLSARGFTDQERQTAEATALDGHPGWVVRTGQALWVPDTRLQAPDRPSKDSPGGGESRSRLWLPVARDGEVFGAFEFASSTPNAFDAADREVLTLVAQLAATAYRRLRAEHVATLDRQRAADAVQGLTRTRFAALLGAIPDAVLGAADDGRIAYWNDAAAALFGQTAHLALGQPLAALIPGLGARRRWGPP
ncbi:MAG: GAF domain-containing protein [Proteobacteria bacterium]|nr:GAF domain-containing protein [Pseudomonadota bacterium]